MTERYIYELIGGPFDGDSVTMIPNGSIGPPNQLTYVTVDPVRKCGAFAIYECFPPFPTWDSAEEYMKFGFVGYQEIGGTLRFAEAPS